MYVYSKGSVRGGNARRETKRESATNIVSSENRVGLLPQLYNYLLSLLLLGEVSNSYKVSIAHVI